MVKSIVKVRMCAQQKMRSTSRLLGLAALLLVLIAADGCGSDPNVEGAKLDLRNKDYSRAMANINKALEKDSENVEALVLKGEILSEMLPTVTDNAERAVYVTEIGSAFSNAVRLDPTQQEVAERRLAILYVTEFNSGFDAYIGAERLPGRERADRFTEAAQHFQNAAVLIPDSAQAFINEAAAYYGAGRMSHAIDAYETAMALGHTDREIYVYLARTHELVAEEFADDGTRAKHYAEMVRALEAGVVSHPEDRELRRLLMNAYAVVDVVPETALAFYAQELPVERDNKVFLYNYGTLMLRQDDFDGAIAMLRSAVEIDPEYANARFNLGAAYVNKAVALDRDYRATEDTLRNATNTLPAYRVRVLEARNSDLRATRQLLYEEAIEHLEAASRLVEDDLGETQDICKALFVAYAQTNQRSRAESVVNCANPQGP